MSKAKLDLKIEQIDSQLAENVTNLKREGALGNGTSATAAMRTALSKNISIDIPEGIYLIDAIDSNDHILPMGNKNGITISGRGKGSVLKLADNIGATKLMFGAGAGQTVKNVTFKDLTIDLNGQNNLQTNFIDPLRYNCFCYFFCYCENIVFENVTIKNISGHQAVRIGNDTANGYGENIRVVNCEIENFGIGLTNNNQQDVSAFYIQANNIKVQSNTSKCNDFTFDLSRGHTAFELHGDSSTIVNNGNVFRNIQQPILIVSSSKPNQNVKIDGNVFDQCNYIVSLDSSTYDQKNISITNNLYKSTKVNSHIVNIGMANEVAKNREDIVFDGNTLIGWGNTNQRTHVFYIENMFIRSLFIRNNRVVGFNGSLLYFAGNVKNNGYAEIQIKNNELDSLGATLGIYPNSPKFIEFGTSSGVVNILDILGNTFANSALKDYTNGIIKLLGGVKYLHCKDNKRNDLTNSYPIIVESLTDNITKEYDLVQNLSGTVAIDPNGVPSSGGIIVNISYTGVEVGDFIVVSPPYDLQGLHYSASVSASNNIKLVLFNPTVAEINLAYGLWKVKIIKH